MPHEGFKKLLELSDTKKYGAYIFTSNVDGQFQKAGFKDERVMECHGSIHHMQCIDNCQGMLWSSDDTFIEIVVWVILFGFIYLCYKGIVISGSLNASKLR